MLGHRDPHVGDSAAALARSIASCPADARLVVDGLADPLADLGDDGLAMHDLDGRPTFACPVDAGLARSATAGAQALLTLASGLGRTGSPERSMVLTLGGPLRALGRQDCRCCGDVREVAALDVGFVLVSHTTSGTSSPPVRVDPRDFGSADHQLNRGCLQRLAAHAEDHHQTELRTAVSAFSGVPLPEVAGVEMTGLTPGHVVLGWVDPTGAHTRRLDFTQRATSPLELGEALRGALDVGIC